jgi:hypothetical protein
MKNRSIAIGIGIAAAVCAVCLAAPNIINNSSGTVQVPAGGGNTVYLPNNSYSDYSTAGGSMKQAFDSYRQQTDAKLANINQQLSDVSQQLQNVTAGGGTGDSSQILKKLTAIETNISNINARLKKVEDMVKLQSISIKRLQGHTVAAEANAVPRDANETKK